jgi:putative tryptophan/tyrosine transport system substrate-binding protein
MRRRDFMTLLGGAVAWPLAAGAQQAGGMRRVGVLLPAAADDPEFQVRIAASHQGLALSGWTIGRNVRIDIRWGAADADRGRKYAGELVALAPDLILALQRKPTTTIVASRIRPTANACFTRRTRATFSGYRAAPCRG